MKIGITCYPGIGGSGILATELGKDLAERGHEVHFISSSSPVRLTDGFHRNIYFHEAEAVDYPVFKYPPYCLSLASKMAEISEKRNLDILHVHYAIPHAASAYLAKKMMKDGIKVITTLHGTDVTIVGVNPGFNPFTGWIINQSDGITAVSQDLRQLTYKTFNIDKEIEVIYNFVDTQRFTPGFDVDMRNLYAPPEHKILIHASNFRQVKQVCDSVKVFNLIQKKVPSTLLMVGEGEEWYPANQLVQQLGIQDQVKFLGKENFIEKILPMGDLFILNSIKESFGLAVLEASACGVPAIVTRIGGLPEVVVEGETGYLSDPHDIEGMAEKGISLLSDENKLKRFKQNARKRAVEHFDDRLIVPQYEAYYRKILG